jgi:hypothetical protein
VIDTFINRDDIRHYVHDTMPWVKTSEWDIAAIAEDIIDVWPSLIGHHPDLAYAQGHANAMQWLDAHIDADVYWPIVTRHRESHSRTMNYYRITDHRREGYLRI